MEEIYPPTKFGATERINLKEYFNSFKELIKKDLRQTPEERLKKEMGLTDIEILTIADSCNLSQLTCEYENCVTYPRKVPENVNGGTRLMEPVYHNKNSTNFAVNKYKPEIEQMTGYYFRNDINLNVPPTFADLRPSLETIVSIFLYKPFSYNFDSKNSSEKLRFRYDIVALGRNTLKEVRKLILCGADRAIYKEASSCSEHIEDASRKYPSGFFFIDNTFYDDLENERSIDYSEPIMKWAKDNKIKDLQSKPLANVTLNELSLRLGYPYLYMHQGDCEHLLVFSDARLLTKEDYLHSKCYPYVGKANIFRSKICAICLKNYPNWFCVGSERFPKNRIELCTKCCNAFNFIDGIKIDDFKMYPFNEI